MEILDLYDDRKIKLNKNFDRDLGEPNKGEYKLSVHLWIMNSEGKFLIQKRCSTRKNNPNRWAYTGGAVLAGELSYEGAIREAAEELGLKLELDDIELLLSFKREHDFVDVWLAKDDIDITEIKMQDGEVCDYKWVTLPELNKIIENGEFVPAVNLYYDLFKKLLQKCYNISI